MSGAGTGPARGRPWSVAVGALRRRPGTKLAVDVSAPIGELAVSNSWVAEGTSLRFTGTLESTIGGVSVVGRVLAPWQGTCRRCLDTAGGELDIALRELCVDDPDLELAYAVGAQWLDLEPILRDACILELPLAPLCREDCQGLCPACGANRNRETCSCEAPIDQRWAALAGLDADEPAEQEEPAQPYRGNGGGPGQRTE